jgi:hypothetical protein
MNLLNCAIFVGLATYKLVFVPIGAGEALFLAELPLSVVRQSHEMWVTWLR